MYGIFSRYHMYFWEYNCHEQLQFAIEFDGEKDFRPTITCFFSDHCRLDQKHWSSMSNRNPPTFYMCLFLRMQSTRAKSYLPPALMVREFCPKITCFIQINVEWFRDIGRECHIDIIGNSMCLQMLPKNQSYILAKELPFVSCPCVYDSLVSFQFDRFH